MLHKFTYSMATSITDIVINSRRRCTQDKPNKFSVTPNMQTEWMLNNTIKRPRK